jgi:hypothetical protein
VSPRVSAGEITQLFRDAHVGFETSDIVSIETSGGEEIVQLVYLLDLPTSRDLSGIVREVGALSGVRRVECNEPFFVA